MSNMDIFTAWILKALEGAAWVIEPLSAGSPFAQVTSLGALRAIYRRSSRPALIRGSTFGLPVFLFGGSLFFQEEGFLLILGAILFLIGSVFLVLTALDLLQQTPRQVAAYERGFVWLENDILHLWTWEQIAKIEVRGGRYRLYSKDGREAAFAASLKDSAFAETAAAALSGLPDPHRPVKLKICPHCGETISADSTRCLFCLEKIEGG